MIVGVIAESGRFPGPMELAALCIRPYMLGTPTFEVKSSISLFIRKPRPSMVTPEPKPPLSVVVLATALPSASMMEKCVVGGLLCWYDRGWRWEETCGADEVLA